MKGWQSPVGHTRFFQKICLNVAGKQSCLGKMLRHKTVGDDQKRLAIAHCFTIDLRHCRP